MRLLLAEDEQALSKALKAILERNHYSVDVVYDGQTALEYLEADNYDGMILDIVINSKFIRCVPPFSLLFWINNGGSQSQLPGSSACTHAGISGIIRCK